MKLPEYSANALRFSVSCFVKCQSVSFDQLGEFRNSVRLVGGVKVCADLSFMRLPATCRGVLNSVNSFRYGAVLELASMKTECLDFQ